MPIYEYACDTCGERYEEWLSQSTDPAPPCPHCDSEQVTRIYSAFATEWKSPLVNWHRIPGSWGQKPPKKVF